MFVSIKKSNFPLLLNIQKKYKFSYFPFKLISKIAGYIAKEMIYGGLTDDFFDYKTMQHYTPLSWYCIEENTNMVSFILKVNNNVFENEIDTKNAIYQSICAKNIEIFDLIIDNVERNKINISDFFNKTLIPMFVRAGNIKKISHKLFKILSKTEDINYNIISKNKDIVQFLLQTVSINKKNKCFNKIENFILSVISGMAPQERIKAFKCWISSMSIDLFESVIRKFGFVDVDELIFSALDDKNSDSVKEKVATLLSIKNSINFKTFNKIISKIKIKELIDMLNKKNVLIDVAGNEVDFCKKIISTEDPLLLEFFLQKSKNIFLDYFSKNKIIDYFESCNIVNFAQKIKILYKNKIIKSLKYSEKYSKTFFSLIRYVVNRSIDENSLNESRKLFRFILKNTLKIDHNSICYICKHGSSELLEDVFNYVQFKKSDILTYINLINSSESVVDIYGKFNKFINYAIKNDLIDDEFIGSIPKIFIKNDIKSKVFANCLANFAKSIDINSNDGLFYFFIENISNLTFKLNKEFFIEMCNFDKLINFVLKNGSGDKLLSLKKMFELSNNGDCFKELLYKNFDFNYMVKSFSNYNESEVSKALEFYKSFFSSLDSSELRKILSQFNFKDISKIGVLRTIKLIKKFGLIVDEEKIGITSNSISINSILYEYNLTNKKICINDIEKIFFLLSNKANELNKNELEIIFNFLLNKFKDNAITSNDIEKILKNKKDSIELKHMGVLFLYAYNAFISDSNRKDEIYKQLNTDEIKNNLIYFCVFFNKCDFLNDTIFDGFFNKKNIDQISNLIIEICSVCKNDYALVDFLIFYEKSLENTNTDNYKKLCEIIIERLEKNKRYSLIAKLAFFSNLFCENLKIAYESKYKHDCFFGKYIKISLINNFYKQNLFLNGFINTNKDLEKIIINNNNKTFSSNLSIIKEFDKEKNDFCTLFSDKKNIYEKCAMFLYYSINNFSDIVVSREKGSSLLKIYFSNIEQSITIERKYILDVLLKKIITSDRGKTTLFDLMIMADKNNMHYILDFLNAYSEGFVDIFSKNIETLKMNQDFLNKMFFSMYSRHNINGVIKLVHALNVCFKSLKIDFHKTKDKKGLDIMCILAKDVCLKKDKSEIEKYISVVQYIAPSYFSQNKFDTAKQISEMPISLYEKINLSNICFNGVMSKIVILTSCVSKCFFNIFSKKPNTQDNNESTMIASDDCLQKQINKLSEANGNVSTTIINANSECFVNSKREDVCLSA